MRAELDPFEGAGDTDPLVGPLQLFPPEGRRLGLLLLLAGVEPLAFRAESLETSDRGTALFASTCRYRQHHDESSRVILNTSVS